MKTDSSNYNYFTSINSIIERLSEKYDNLDYIEIDGNFFIVRPITRKEYQYVYTYDTNDYEKKDLICNLCLLYPSNFDLENCSAGIPEKIYEKVMDISYIEKEKTIELINIYREEMQYLDNQMLCIISKAFPSYKYDELEDMNMIQVCKLYTRAEWILNNMVDDKNILDILDILGNNNNDDIATESDNEIHQEYENKYNLPIDNYDDKPISKMTEEQKRAMDEFYRKYPEFNKQTDYVYTGRKVQEYKDPPALRVNRR